MEDASVSAFAAADKPGGETEGGLLLIGAFAMSVPQRAAGLDHGQKGASERDGYP